MNNFNLSWLNNYNQEYPEQWFDEVEYPYEANYKEEMHQASEEYFEARTLEKEYVNRYGVAPDNITNLPLPFAVICIFFLIVIYYVYNKFT